MDPATKRGGRRERQSSSPTQRTHCSIMALCPKNPTRNVSRSHQSWYCTRKTIKEWLHRIQGEEINPEQKRYYTVKWAEVLSNQYWRRLNLCYPLALNLTICNQKQDKDYTWKPLANHILNYSFIVAAKPQAHILLMLISHVFPQMLFLLLDCNDKHQQLRYFFHFLWEWKHIPPAMYSPRYQSHFLK